jgi:hypothetical protein
MDVALYGSGNPQASQRAQDGLNRAAFTHGLVATHGPMVSHGPMVGQTRTDPDRTNAPQRAHAPTHPPGRWRNRNAA